MAMIKNDDGTVTVTLVPTAKEKHREVVLRVASMGEIGRLYDLVDEADKLLGDPPPPITRDSTAEQVKAFNDANRVRSRKAFSAESPHAKAWVQAIKLLGNLAAEPTVDDLPSWMGNPVAFGELVGLYQNP